MVYSKVSMDSIHARNPQLTIGELVAATIEDHSRTNGCEFQDGAAAMAIDQAGLSAGESAISLSESDKIRVSQILETLEIKCDHRD